jgi:hypothetical protein
MYQLDQTLCQMASKYPTFASKLQHKYTIKIQTLG